MCRQLSGARATHLAVSRRQNVTFSKNGQFNFSSKQGLDRRQSALSGSDLGGHGKNAGDCATGSGLTVMGIIIWFLYNRLSGFQSQWLEEAVPTAFCLIISARIVFSYRCMSIFGLRVIARQGMPAERELAKVGEDVLRPRTLQKKVPKPPGKLSSTRPETGYRAIGTSIQKQKHPRWHCTFFGNADA